MDFTFELRAPGPPLGRHIESIWYARGQIPYRRERIAPTGSTVAVFVLGAPILETPADGLGEPVLATDGFLIGPHDRPTINEPTAETHAVGIVTTPVGCRAAFGIGPSTIRGGVVQLLPVWSEAQELRAELVTLTAGSTVDAAAVLDAVEQRLGASAAGSGVVPRSVSRCETAVAALEIDPRRSIADIADEVGITHAHLDREFTATIGLSPRTLARILRLRRLLDVVDVHGEVNWSHLAAEFGWFDQSHFIRDFKRHTGVTPTAYAAVQQAQFAPTDAAAGFVPET